MQREIKFRGKRKGEGGEWLVGDLNHIEGGVYIFPRTEDTPLNSPDWFEVIPESIGQFTGRVDGGIEIYENDWCEAKFRTKEGVQVIQGKIIMDEYMWCIDCVGSVGNDVFSINRPHDFKVLGNTTDNPELVNQ